MIFLLNKHLLRIFCFLSITMLSTYSSNGLITEESTTNEVIDAVYSNLYEFNYCCQPIKPKLPYSVKSFLSELPHCGPSIISQNPFFSLVNKSIDLIKYYHTQPNAYWIDSPQLDLLLDAAEINPIFGQSLIVSPDTKVMVMGDLHGNVHSLARNLTQLQYAKLMDEHGKLNNKIMIIITGDLGDRGHYSVETWTLALALKNQNPEQVIILQGNHELAQMFSSFGFEAEILAKFFPDQEVADFETINNTILKLFKLLPQVCFIGATANNGEKIFIQYCHGGIGVHAKDAEKTKYGQIPTSINNINIEQLLRVATHKEIGTLCYQVYLDQPEHTGFLWNSFYADPSPDAPAIICGSRNCGDVVFHGKEVNEYLRQISEPGLYSVDAICRGHDHMPDGINQLKFSPAATPMEPDLDWSPVTDPVIMKFKHEDEGYPVYTFTSAPEIYDCDSFAILEFNPEAGAWTMNPYIFNVPKKPDHFKWHVKPYTEISDFTFYHDKSTRSRVLKSY